MSAPMLFHPWAYGHGCSDIERAYPFSRVVESRVVDDGTGTRERPLAVVVVTMDGCPPVYVFEGSTEEAIDFHNDFVAAWGTALGGRPLAWPSEGDVEGR